MVREGSSVSDGRAVGAKDWLVSGRPTTTIAAAAAATSASVRSRPGGAGAAPLPPSLPLASTKSSVSGPSHRHDVRGAIMQAGEPSLEKHRFVSVG